MGNIWTGSYIFDGHATTKILKELTIQNVLQVVLPT